MSEWKEYRLSDLMEIKYGKDHKHLADGSYPLFGSGGIMRYVEKSIYEEESILIPRKGTLSNLFYVNEPFWSVDTMFWSKIKQYKVLPKYLYYTLKTYNLAELNVGSAVPSLTTEVLNKVDVTIPNIEIQSAIAEILSSLDDKIELNNKINQELENLAQTLFKRWFIDFEFPNENGEPYKSSGGEMVESELGEIPKGWGVYSMDELLETVSKTYPLKKVSEVVFLNTGDIQDGKFLHKNFSNPQNLPGQAKKSISQNDILYSEIRPANKRFAYVYFDSSQYVVSTKLMVLRSKVEMNSLFQYFYLTQQESIKHLQQLAESRSGTFPQITFSEVSTIKIALPDFDLVNTFVEIALKPYYDNQFHIKEENESLVNLRDTLLPKLISGELEVADVTADNKI
jgi:type I restriction enzyme S subunit